MGPNSQAKTTSSWNSVICAVILREKNSGFDSYGAEGSGSATASFGEPTRILSGDRPMRNRER